MAKIYKYKEIIIWRESILLMQNRECLFSSMASYTYSMHSIGIFIDNIMSKCYKLFYNICKEWSLKFAGYRNTDGSFNNLGSNAYFWSASENSSTNAWNRNLNSGNSQSGRGNFTKGDGFSVRCLRD